VYPRIVADRTHPVDLEFALSRRPLRAWALLSFVCAAVALWVCGARLFAAIGSDRTGITFCIVIVFLAMWLRSLIDACYIDREFRRTQAAVEALFVRADAKGDLVAFKRYAAPCLFRRHVADLMAIYDRDSRIEQDNLAELMHVRLRARLRPLDVGSSTMLTLGLVGTIIGLITAVEGLANAMAQAGGDQGGLKEAMNATFGGMGTAFSATLMGSILGGVVLRLIYTSLSAQADHLVAYIAQFTEVFLLPVLRNEARRQRGFQPSGVGRASDDEYLEAGL